MKRMNKYIRNKHHRNLYWNRVRAKEQPFKTFFPHCMGGSISSKWSHEEQVKRHFEKILNEARAMENGHHGGLFHSTSGYRRLLNKEKKARERVVLAKIRQGNYDAEMPHFKRDADFFFF